MNWINPLMGFIRAHETLITLILSALILSIIIFNLCLLIKLGKLSKSRKTAQAMVDGLSLEDIEELARRLDRLEQQMTLSDEGQRTLDKKLALGIQRVGFVRFDAFPDIGGEQSFALALLDRDMNGVVVSSLYSRADSRVYSKEITAGQSQHALSDEEREALRRAGTLAR